MLPSVEDWLSDSWTDFRRRFWPVMSVLAATGIATVIGVLLPPVPAALAQFFAPSAAWLLWIGAFLVSLVAGLVLSTWGQAAAMIAAGSDAGTSDTLSAAWKRAPGFAWVLTLASLAVGGGLALLVIPGLVLAVLLLPSLFYQLDGETAGLAALELSWARVKPRLGPVAGRLFALTGLLWAPSMIPYVGWLISPLFAPFGLVAAARLAADLKKAEPDPVRPRLAAPVAALSAVLLVAFGAGTFAMFRAGQVLAARYAAGSLSLTPPDPSTAASLMAVLQGQGTEEDAKRSISYVVSLSSAAAAPQPPPPGAP